MKILTFFLLREGGGIDVGLHQSIKPTFLFLYLHVSPEFWRKNIITSLMNFLIINRSLGMLYIPLALA